MIYRPSPNADTRRPDTIIDTMVLHYTGMRTGEEALERLCDPACKVSAHYMIEEDGRLFSLVPEHKRAWHAGLSEWRGHSDINNRSIGIEIVNPGHGLGYRPFTVRQMETVAHVCQEIIARHSIPARHVVGHSDIAHWRKNDPGEFFDWPFLAQKGIGLYPVGEKTPTDQDILQDLLRRIGYKIDADEATADTALLAFQRHFQPDALGQPGSPASLGRLKAVAEAMEQS